MSQRQVQRLVWEHCRAAVRQRQRQRHHCQQQTRCYAVTGSWSPSQASMVKPTTAATKGKASAARADPKMTTAAAAETRSNMKSGTTKPAEAAAAGTSTSTATKSKKSTSAKSTATMTSAGGASGGAKSLSKSTTSSRPAAPSSKVATAAAAAAAAAPTPKPTAKTQTKTTTKTPPPLPPSSAAPAAARAPQVPPKPVYARPPSKAAETLAAEDREAALRAARIGRQKRRDDREAEMARVEEKSRDYDRRYKSASRRWVASIIALPIFFVTSYYLYDRLVLGNEQKMIPSAMRQRQRTKTEET